MGLLGNMLARLQLDATDFNSGMDKSERAVSKFGSTVESVGAKLSIAISLPLLGVGAAALKAAGDMEQTQVAFTTLLKSADAAKAHLADLKAFALSTPFQFEDLTKASRMMQAFGTNASDVVPKLRVLGNAVSALGGGNELLDRVVRSMGEIGTRGRITGEQLRELSRAGIPALEAIAQKLGISVAEAQSKITAGMVDAKVATDALMEYMNKRFAGGMEAQSHTLLGMWSNIKDKLTFTLVAIGDAMIPWAKNFVEKTLDPMLGKIKDLAEAFAKLPKPIQDVTLAGIGAAAAFPLLVIAMGSVVTNSIVIVGAFSRLIPIFGALITMVQGQAIAAFSSFATWMGTLGTLAGGLVSLGIAAVIVQVIRLIDTLRQLKDAQADLATSKGQSDATLAKLENLMRQRGINIDAARKQYDADIANAKSAEAAYAAYQRYADALSKLNQEYVAHNNVAKDAMTVEAALAALNVKSTADRLKGLETAKQAYDVLAKSGTQNAEVMAEALKRVKEAEDAVYGERKTLEVKEHFKALKNETSEFAILAEQFNQALARQKQLLSDTAKNRSNALFSFFDTATAGRGEKPAMGDFFDAKTLGDAENGMKGILAAANALPPEMKRINDAMAAFGINTEKANVPDLTRQFETLSKAYRSGEIDQRSYNQAFIKYIEDLNAAGVALDKNTVKEYELRKARTQQLQNSKKEEGEYQREARRTFQGLERGIASSLVHWKGFGAAVKGVFQDLGESVLSIMLKHLLKPIEDLFGKLIEKLASKLIGLFVIQKAGASGVDVGEVAGAAAVGGAAAAASIAAIPIIGPALAPEAGAAMYAAILGTYTPLAMFEQGGNVPTDMPAFLHAKEMVLPADIAVPLRKMVAGGDVASGGGGFHIHIGNMTGVTRDTVDVIGNKLIRQARLAGARI